MQVGFAERAEQRRVTVLFRLLLAVPHGVALSLVGVAAAIVLVIGWLRALSTGRLPHFAAEFLTGYLRWQTRYYSYTLMLTDAYPPFSLRDGDYPVRLRTRPGQLTRKALLLRLILSIPAAVVAALALLGVLILSFFGWLIALACGRLPAVLHNAVGAVVRYAARYYGYAAMLTSDYPGGLFGDGPATEQADPGADPWRLVVSTGAKVVVSLSVIVGLLVVAGGAMAAVTIRHHADVASQQEAHNLAIARAKAAKERAAARLLSRAISQLNRADNTLTQQVNSETDAADACMTLACRTTQVRKIAASQARFAAAVGQITMPAGDTVAARGLVTGAQQLARDYDAIAAATTQAQYNALVGGVRLQLDNDAFESDYQTLALALNTAK